MANEAPFNWDDLTEDQRKQHTNRSFRHANMSPFAREYKLHNDLGCIILERQGKVKVKLEFFDRLGNSTNIIKQYPNEFWQNDYYKPILTKAIDETYSLNNGSSGETYFDLCQKINNDPLPEFGSTRVSLTNANPEYTQINGSMDYIHLEDNDSFYYGFGIENIIPGMPDELRYKFILIDKYFKILESNTCVFEEDKILMKTTPIFDESIRWNLESLLNPSTESINPYYLFRLIQTVFDHYIDFGEHQNQCTSFFSLWVMGTYVHRVFNSFPYIYLGGTHGCGKTKAIDIVRMLAFNALHSSSITPSAMFRMVEKMSSTLLIDENESLKHIGKDNDLGREFRGMLNSGYKKGSKVYRTEKNVNKEFGLKAYNVFCPKMIANITGLDTVLESRTISFIMTKTLSTKGDNEVDDFSKIWSKIRELLYRFGLHNAIEIANEYNNFKQGKIRIRNRDWELWKPIIVMAKYVDLCQDNFDEFSNRGRGGEWGDLFEIINKGRGTQDIIDILGETMLGETLGRLVISVHEDMIALSQIKTRRREDAEATENLDHKVAHALVDEYKIDSNNINASNIRARLLQDYEIGDKQCSIQWIGVALKRIGLMNKRKSHGKMVYKVTSEEIDNLKLRFNIEG